MLWIHWHNPAMEKFMTSEESGLGRPLTFGLGQLMIWSLGLGLFGVFLPYRCGNKLL